VYKQFTEYLDYQKLLRQNQSGFRKTFSCETALQKVMNDFKYNIDKGNAIVAVFLDLYAVLLKLSIETFY
jgi:hypothetical protein